MHFALCLLTMAMICWLSYVGSPLPCLELSFLAAAGQPSCTKISIELKLILMLGIAQCRSV